MTRRPESGGLRRAHGDPRSAETAAGAHDLRHHADLSHVEQQPWETMQDPPCSAVPGAHS